MKTLGLFRYHCTTGEVFCGHWTIHELQKPQSNVTGLSSAFSKFSTTHLTMRVSGRPEMNPTATTKPWITMNQNKRRGWPVRFTRLVRWIRTLYLMHLLPCLMMNRMIKPQLTTMPSKTEDFLNHHPRPLTLEA